MSESQNEIKESEVENIARQAVKEWFKRNEFVSYEHIENELKITALNAWANGRRSWKRPKWMKVIKRLRIEWQESRVIIVEQQYYTVTAN